MEMLSPSFPYAIFLAVFVIAALFSWGVTAAVRAFATRAGVVARRDARRRHDRATPLLGGTAFFLAASGATLFCWLEPGMAGAYAIPARAAMCFVSAIAVVFGIGALDDVIELKAPPKFAAQCLAAVLVLAARPELPPLLQGIALPKWLVAAGLVLWIVGVTNAMNMIDGLDGLCAGVGGMSAANLAVIMALAGTGAGTGHCAILGVVVAGCSVGFLFHNFCPARIFLGDSGSLLLGFLLAVMSIEVEAKRSLFVSLSIPVLTLGFPLLDIALSMIRRQRERRSLFHGDRSHLHHRLQQLGLSQRGAVIFLWCVSGYLSFVTCLLARSGPSGALHIYASVVPTLGFWLATLFFVERRLSYQTARFSHLFLRNESLLFTTRERMVEYLKARSDEYRLCGSPFTVVILESTQFLKQLVRERPARVVEFYMRLYAVLQGRVRTTDLVARSAEAQIAVILAGAGTSNGSELAVVTELKARVRDLQESFNIFQAHSSRPEGFSVLQYPRDAREIWRRLELSEDDPAGGEARAEIAA